MKSLNVYIVHEGEVYGLDNCPSGLNQDNWLSDWVFVGACSTSEALAVAGIVDDMANKRKGKVYGKMLRLRAIRGRLLSTEALNPSEIYKSQGRKSCKERKHLTFNQGWVKI